MKFLILGASGMAGHTISVYLVERGYEVDTFSRRPFPYGRNIVGDAGDLKCLKQVIAAGGYDCIINCIGILNQFAESDKTNAVLLNSLLPHWLAKETAGLKAHTIHMSTDCVFSGENGHYDENAFPDGRTFYDRSKALGELSDGRNLTFRNSIIGPDISAGGIGLFNWFMRQKQPVDGYTGAIWSGVTTLTLAKAMEQAASDRLTGIYHLTNNAGICKYDLLCLFNKYFRRNQLKINPVAGIIADKTLVNNRKDFAFRVPDYEKMVYEMSVWVKEHSELYPHYHMA